MTAIDTWPVQQAVYTLLQADAGLAALVNDRIYDDVPQPVGFPYVSLGPDVVTPDRTSDGDGLEVIMTLEIRTNYRGLKQVKQIRHAIRLALDCQDLTVSGLTSCIAFDDGGQDLKDPDGIRRHGLQRIRLICRE